MKTTSRSALGVTLGLALSEVLFQHAHANNLGFHRDEFLYLALGRHLDWGFWSNGPFIGLLAWFSQTFLGDSLWATRLLPALAGGALVLLTGLMVRRLGGGQVAQLLCGVAMLGSLAWLRAFGMLQPVPFDVLCWAALSYLLLRWLKDEDPRWWWAIGAVAGVGFLNKYTLVFWAAALLLALLCTPQRRVLLTRAPWMAVALALLIVSPNLWWQCRHDFPVVSHMRDLAKEQLSHVEPLNFLVDQLLFHGLGGMLVWLPGLWLLLRGESGRPYRLAGWFYVAVLFLFLVLKGKSYYTIGAYPVLIAAGAVQWESWLRKTWLRLSFLVLVIALSLPLVPVGIALWDEYGLVAYFQRMKLEPALRWEDGKVHALPQDYADRLGWPELAAHIDTAFLRGGDPRQVLLYCENYGQAGAAETLCKGGKRTAVSFSDSYRLWAPKRLPAEVNTLIYVNDELGADVQALFADIQKVGEITNPLAREHGTSVWLCRSPREDFPAFWEKRVREVMSDE